MPPKKKKAPEAEPPPAQAPVELTGDEPNERIIPGANDWEPAKIMIKPREQLQLSDKELQEEFTKILRADNPEAPKTIIRFSHKEKCFKLEPSVDQLELHYQQEGCLLNVQSDDAKKQKEREEDEKRNAAAEVEKRKAEGGEVDDDASNLRNQFNFSERASQTLNFGSRSIATITEPPASVEYAATANEWWCRTTDARRRCASRGGSRRRRRRSAATIRAMRAKRTAKVTAKKTARAMIARVRATVRRT